MDQNGSKFPNNNDILVLKENRKVIYSYNENGKSNTSYNIAVCIEGDRPKVRYALSNDDTVSLTDNKFDFATNDEIDVFYDAIINDSDDKVEPFIDSITEMLLDFTGKTADMKQKNNISNKIKDIINYIEKLNL